MRCLTCVHEPDQSAGSHLPGHVYHSLLFVPLWVVSEVCWFHSLQTKLGWASCVPPRQVLPLLWTADHRWRLSPTGPHSLQPASPPLGASHCFIQQHRRHPAPLPHLSNTASAVRSVKCQSLSGWWQKRGKNAFLLDSQFRGYKGHATCPQTSYISPCSLVLSQFLFLTAQISFYLQWSLTQGLRGLDPKAKQTPGQIQKCSFSSSQDGITRSGSLVFIFSLQNFHFCSYTSKTSGRPATPRCG